MVNIERRVVLWLWCSVVFVRYLLDVRRVGVYQQAIVMCVVLCCVMRMCCVM